MSSSRAKDNIPGGQRRSYISTQTFAGQFYTYRTEVQDLDIVGIWGQVTEDSDQCPKGRILRENGRKLYPGANPNVDAYFVGVYDSVTFLSGFINPNESRFAVFNSDKPVYLSDNHYAFDGVSEDGSEADEYDLGAPVYTKGNIETVNGNIIANAAGFPKESEYYYNNYITLNDVSGDASAYFAFDGANQPYVEVDSDNYNAYGKMKASDITAELYLLGHDISGNDNELQAFVGDGEITLDLTVNYSSTTNAIYTLVNSTEAYVQAASDDYDAYGKMKASGGVAELYLLGHDISGNDNELQAFVGNGEVTLNIDVAYGSTINSIHTTVNSDEASIEVTGHDLSGNENYVNLYGADGSISNSGLIYPYNARGTLNINGTCHGSTINQLLVQSNFVILTRVGYSGTAGHLSYDVTNSTLTVHSTENEVSNINYLILGSAP